MSLTLDTADRLYKYVVEHHTTIAQAVTDWIWAQPVTEPATPSQMSQEQNTMNKSTVVPHNSERRTTETETPFAPTPRAIEQSASVPDAMSNISNAPTDTDGSATDTPVNTSVSKEDQAKYWAFFDSAVI